MTVEQPAYLKAVLHAARYPSSPILGLLIGRITTLKPLSIIAIDALPLFHHHPIGPLVEVALLQAEAFARLHSGGAALVGVYSACEPLDKKDVSSVTQKIANKIAEHNGGAVIMVVSRGIPPPASHPFSRLPPHRGRPPLTRRYHRCTCLAA